MRISLLALVVLTLNFVALGSEPNIAQASTEVRVRVSETGKCIVGSTSIDCPKLATHLLSAHVDRNSRVLLNVDDKAKVEAVGAALESLQSAGFSDITMTATNGSANSGT
jgi:biopolymer transport protein ExbD